MGSTGKPDSLNYEFVKRFLRTAVVVDDRPYMESERSAVPKKVIVPDRHAPASLSRTDLSTVDRVSKHDLNARSIMDSFAELGVICGVVIPSRSDMEVMRKADIVILDWLLKEDDPEYALKLLYDLLTGKQKKQDRNSLRLVAIYTGEARLEEKIYNPIFSKLQEAELNPEKDENNNMVLSYQHGRVVLYAKPGVNLPESLKDRIVEEGDLPGRLVEDFSEMTEGLLPGIAITSLTAVREGEHRVLDQFSADLDPAFLTQRVCISDPDDVEQQIVNHVAEELRGLMDNLVAEESPADTKEVEYWIRRRNTENGCFKFGKKQLSLEDTITLAKGGLKSSKLNDNDFKNISAGFACREVDDELDLRLAWMMSFRTVFNVPPPTLWLGSVVTGTGNGDENYHLICMRPRCDCVRLEKETLFFFLPLIEQPKGKEQLVLKLGRRFKRVGIELDSADWVLSKFKPSENKQKVTAMRNESEGLDDLFVFEDTERKQYIWRGELKGEYAQRIAQTFATKLSRAAIDESEWLRRMTRK